MTLWQKWVSGRTTHFNLLLIIANDLARHKVRVLLFLLVLASALGVILSSHHNRQQLIVLETLQKDKYELEEEWRNLVLEQRSLTEHNKIQASVEKQLNMHRPTPEEEVLVRVK